MRLGLESAERGWRPESDDGGRDPLAETPHVVPEADEGRAVRTTLESLDEPTDDAVAVLERQPRVAFAPLLAGRQLHPAGMDAQIGDPAGEAIEPARRWDRMEEREAERRLHRGGPEIRVDPLEDRLEPIELPWRVEVEDLVDQRIVPIERREPVTQEAPGRVTRIVLGGTREVLVVDRRMALFATADLVAADRAAVVLPDEATDRTLVREPLPDEFVDDRRAVAGRAASREPFADRDLEARLKPRCGGDRLERRVEMTHVGRSKDDFGEEAGERVRLEGDSPSLAIDGGPGDPAAATVEVNHDVTGRRVGLDRGLEHVG